MHKYILVLLFLCSIVADEKSQHHLRKVSIDITSSYTNEKINAQVFLNKELIAHEQQLKPGNYQLQIQHSGYTTLHKEITISEGSESFLIKEKLHAKPRQISFELFYTRHSRGCPDAHEVIDMNTGKKVEFRDEFKPGEEQCFAVKFKQYQTRIVKAILPPGEDPYILQVPLIELYPLEFTIRKNSAVVDGIEYKYQFRFDNEPLEKHHIKIEKGIGRFYYTVMRPENAKNLRAYIGYKFLQRSIARFRSGMSLGRPENLSVPKFIEHLDIVAKKELGRLGSLQVVERFVKGFRHRKMLKQLDETQKDLLMNYLNSWKFDDEEHRVRLQKVIAKILSFYH